jgi:cytosine/adenosine deaminase-related metal-dependent hydrolase
MEKNAVINASRISTEPGVEPTRSGGRIVIEDGVISRIDAAELPAGNRLLAMPALGNGHDHGRGAKFLAFGLRDDALEAWVPGFYARPEIDPYLNAVAIMGRFAEAGIASAIHCHTMPRTSEDMEREIAAVSKAAHDVGIRIGLAIPMRDRNRFCYGDDENVLSLFDEKDRAEIVANYGYTPLPPKEQVAQVEDLAKRYASDLVHIQFAPTGVQWASDELLESVAEASARTGLRIHMHLLESKYQREWLDFTYREGVVKALDKMGFLSSRLTVAHGVWLRPDELDVLADRGVIVSLNTSSNLRLGSGIAPAREMVARNIKFALGLDGMALDDDDDPLREMRLAGILHRGPGFADKLPIEKLFAASMAVVPEAVSGSQKHGKIRSGMVADIVTLDYASLSHDVIDGLLDEAELVLARGSTRHVHSLFVAGRQIVKEGKAIGIDVRSVEAELARQITGQKSAIQARANIVRTYQDKMRLYYSSQRHICGCESSGGAIKCC